MRVVLFIFLSLVPLLAEDFISEFEYGQMLYNDPRGVSCVSCHGETGEGKHIANYRIRDKSSHKVLKKISIDGPDIRNATLEQIKDSTQKGKGIMPKYFLTDKEVKTIHAYIQAVNSDNNESKND